MKKIMVVLMVMIGLFFCMGVNAEEVLMKISMDHVVKPAKEIGSGKGISFTLPELDDNDYYIYAVELAVFEKQDGESQWHIYQDDAGEETKKRYIESPDSLNFSVDFGDLSSYRKKAKYKMAYRYYVRNIHDASILCIAGEDEKDGWRLVGEEDPLTATQSGFLFYQNTNPSMSIESFSYQYHSIDGLQTKRCSPSELSSIFFPADVFTNGITVQIAATDFDAEDVLSVSYTLKDAISGETVASGELPYDKTIKTDHKSEFFMLQLSVSDNFGGSTTSEWMTFMVDNEPAQIVNKFFDGGHALKGKNLFSDFYVTDDQNEAMTEGRVFARLYRDGGYLEMVELEKREGGIYRLDKTEMADGMYIVELVLFDKAGNESQDTFTQTLDNTGPQIRFVSPAENAEATLYSTWMNESKHIIFDAKDETGVNECYIYLQGKLDYFVSYNTMYLEKTITRPVTNKETGKLNYTGYVYDNAKTVDKTNNTYIADSPGNYTLFSREIWLDKTEPAISASHDDTIWYEAPYTVTALFYDYPSKSGVNDVSGVRDKQYAITEDDTRPTQWTDYTDGVTLTNGGVYYLHFKCVDFAGNETVTTEKIKINTPSQIIGTVRPTEDYKHTIYYSSPGFYVIKNTAYNTKYHFELKEPDVDDTIKAEIALISKDNASIYALSDTISYPTGEIERDIVFNVAYIDESDNQLPDGVYDMFITLTEGKEDEEEVKTHDKVFGCEVVIKRNAPPTPIINTDSGEVMIDYPEETLTGSLNSETIKAHYKKQYKTVKDGDGSSNTYKTYTGAFDAEDGIVTALYTDIAGNTSIATKRIFQDNGIGGSETDDILTDGNTTTVEESRAANTYYIGIRREKERGINTDVFDFMN